MSMTFENLSILHPDYMLPIAIERMNGEFVGKYFIPDRPVTNVTYRWRYFGVVGGMTPEVGENDKGPLTHTRYEQRSGRVRPYKERDFISKFVNLTEGRPIVKDALANLTKRFALRQEQLRISAIVNAAYMNSTVGSVSVDSKTYFWLDLADTNEEWDDGSGPVDPIKNILNAQKQIKKYGKVITDTIMCSPDAVNALKNATGLKQWDRTGPLSRRVIVEGELIENKVPGSVGRLAGHEIFEINTDVLTDQEDEDSALIPITDAKDAYIFKRGSDLGAMHVLKGLFTRSNDKQMRDAIELQVGGWMYPDIFRPQLIFALANVVINT